MKRLLESNIEINSENPRGGLNLCFNLNSTLPLQQSPTWATAGWALTFIHLGAHAELELGGGHFFVKVIVGRLTEPDRGCLGEPVKARSTRVAQSTIRTGERGCLLALFEQTATHPANLTDIAQAAWSGPEAQVLTWQRFDEKFAGIIDAFDGLDCYMGQGFHVLDADGTEIVYLNPWCCGKGVDLSTHNHGQRPHPLAPAFAEVHLTLHNGTGKGGMYEISEPGDRHRVSHPLQAGEEHGPYFFLDSDGKPERRENGAVSYPWHGWRGGLDDAPGQAYDYVAAFEINPDYI